MKINSVMDEYAKHERVGIEVPGYSKMNLGNVIRFVAQQEWGSFVSYYQLRPDQLDKAIEKEIEFFKSCGKNFEWKVYDTDKPKEIKQYLIQHGFEEGEAESFMLMDLSEIEDYLPESNACVEVTDPAGIRDYISVAEKVWGGDHSGQEAHLIASKQNAPENTSLYVIYENGLAVSSARIEYTSNSPFAGIWGGSTLEDFRGRGHYSALLHKRINDAKKRGVKYLTIDASDMSRPIVEKYGFRFITTTTPYEYLVK